MSEKRSYLRYGIFGGLGTAAGLGFGFLNYQPGST